MRVEVNLNEGKNVPTSHVSHRTQSRSGGKRALPQVDDSFGTAWSPAGPHHRTPGGWHRRDIQPRRDALGVGVGQPRELDDLGTAAQSLDRRAVSVAPRRRAGERDDGQQAQVREGPLQEPADGVDRIEQDEPGGRQAMGVEHRGGLHHDRRACGMADAHPRARHCDAPARDGALLHRRGDGERTGGEVDTIMHRPPRREGCDVGPDHREAMLGQQIGESCELPTAAGEAVLEPDPAPWFSARRRPGRAQVTRPGNAQHQVHAPTMPRGAKATKSRESEGLQFSGGHVSLAGTEIRRAKLRFGLLTGAVALLVFLVLLLSTLSGALIGALVGALQGLQTDGLAYADFARDNIAASRMEPAVVDAVSAVPGVASAGGVGTFTTSAIVDGTAVDVQVFGFEPEAPGAPSGLSDGRLPAAPGEAAADGGNVAIGDTVTLDPAGTTLTVVGLLRGAQFNALPTMYTTLGTFAEAAAATNPGLPFVPINAVAFDVAEGADPVTVAAAITADVPGVKGYTRDDAVALIPGIESITQSFGILVGLTFIIGIVVIGFFFLILTVQKLKPFTLLRAIGTGTGRLAATIAVQITIVVLAASVIALGLTLLAVQGLNTGIPVRLDPGLIIGTVMAVWICSLLAGLLSIRRIARIDPASAVGAR